MELDDRSEAVCVSVISIGELHAGIELAPNEASRSERLRRLAAVLAAIPVLIVDAEVAGRYGELRRATGRVPSNDLWIAATALAHSLTLLTRDERLAGLPGVATELVR